jgi:5'-3' exonuclease
MDCNSIIYDVFNSFNDEEKGFSIERIENIIIERVIRKIEGYIILLNPANLAYIAFDGVAPFAKMEQQRSRRYKSAHMEHYIQPKLMLNTSDKPKCKWSTCNITPGTPFMKKLSLQVNEHFHNYCGKQKIIVSASNIDGEGEQKIFEEIRNSGYKNENVFVYGLDSDLIMLSIFHLELRKNIYVLREAPEFSKSQLQIKGNTNELLCMNIEMLSKYILHEMDCIKSDKHRIKDYIVLCFFLGNDFLPHFPSLNIRKSGIQILLEAYNKKIGNNENKFIISKETGELDWKILEELIVELSKGEHENLVQEELLREKMEKYKFKDVEELLLNTPILCRGVEKYICVKEDKWEERYYRTLFERERTKENVKEICIKYVEGIEWVYKYYSAGCKDWKWKYKYKYGPLLIDLKKEMGEMGEIKMKKREGYSGEVQLIYVMPWGIIEMEMEEKIRELIKKHIGETKMKMEEIEYEWSYCRYMWESHIKLKEIEEETLDKMEKEIRVLCHGGAADCTTGVAQEYL